MDHYNWALNALSNYSKGSAHEWSPEARQDVSSGPRCALLLFTRAGSPVLPIAQTGDENSNQMWHTVSSVCTHGECPPLEYPSKCGCPGPFEAFTATERILRSAAAADQEKIAIPKIEEVGHTTRHI